MKFPITVEWVLIGVSGDSSVGIQSEEYEAQCNIEMESASDLVYWRSRFQLLYAEFCESPRCSFDFEVKAEQEAEDKAFCTCQNSEGEGVRHLANDCPVHGIGK